MTASAPKTGRAAAFDGVGDRDAVSDGAAEYAAAVAALRALWQAERRPDETVADWLVRTGRRKGVLA